MTTTEFEKSAIWIVDEQMPEEQLDFIIDEARRLGQCYYQFLGKIGCLTIEALDEM